LRHLAQFPQPASATAAAGLGVSVAKSIKDVKGDTLAIGAHGVGPEIAKK